MVEFGAFVVAQAVEQHLHQSALVDAIKTSVGFDSPAHKHMIGLAGDAIKMDRYAVRSLTQNHCFHARMNRTTESIFAQA